MNLKDAELIESIWKIALLNAVRHNGRSQTGPVMGKTLGEKPELKTNIKELSALVDTIVKDVNNLPFCEQKRMIEEKWPTSLMKEKTKEEKNLPPLQNVDQYPEVVTRFSPNPDCVLHLGSARAIVLCHEYAHKYAGKFILRFEDTDPKGKKPVLEFYDSIKEDLVWLECKQDEEYIQSDRVPIYYEYTERLLRNDNAYVCTCVPEQFRKLILVGKPCKCRNLPTEEHIARWQRMVDGDYKEGEAVVRVKTDLEHPNPAVRDWPAFRVIDVDRYPHPRVGSKYHAWPLYNLASGVDDHLMGITHIIRGKEHLTNMIRQEYLYNHLGWKYPEAIHYGRLKIAGASLSKSKIAQGIREGLYDGWDDPRLATFVALRRRGIMPEAIRRMIIDIGPKTADVVLSWENLYAYNRKILDPKVNRYFFVQTPTELKVDNLPKVLKPRLQLHPDYPERGFREYTIEPKGNDRSVAFWISRKDANVSRIGCEIRLMELCNIKIKKTLACSIEATFASESYEEAKSAKLQLIHWVPIADCMPCKVIMQDTMLAEGFAEDACRELKSNDIIQFERFGFVRIEKVGKILTACYTHK